MLVGFESYEVDVTQNVIIYVIRLHIGHQVTKGYQATKGHQATKGYHIANMLCIGFRHATIRWFKTAHCEMWFLLQSFETAKLVRRLP